MLIFNHLAILGVYELIKKVYYLLGGHLHKQIYFYVQNAHANLIKIQFIFIFAHAISISEWL